MVIPQHNPSADSRSLGGRRFNSKVEAVGLVPVEACRAAKAGVFAMVEVTTCIGSALFESCSLQLLEEAARGAESNKAASEALTELQLHLQENIKSKLESADVRNGETANTTPRAAKHCCNRFGVVKDTDR